MKHTIRIEGESDTEYLLRTVECMEENVSELSYKLIKANDKIEILENYIKIVDKFSDKNRESISNLLSILKDYTQSNIEIYNKHIT